MPVLMMQRGESEGKLACSGMKDYSVMQICVHLKIPHMRIEVGFKNGSLNHNSVKF